MYLEQEPLGCQVIQLGVLDTQRHPHAVGPDQIFHVERAGWPFLSLHCQGELDRMAIRRAASAMSTQAWHGEIAVPMWLQRREAGGELFFPTYQRPLPLIPLWPGFAMNTVFYAAVLWALFALPFVVRRHFRVRRGLCPKCAYPVGVSEVCTECGAAVTPKAGEMPA
jgi:hypothetical protein